MIDAVTAVIFLGAASYAVVMVWRKIPLLLQVPQQLIEESFVTRPSRIKKYSEPLMLFFRERRYRDFYYTGLIWTLHRLRLWLLRFERVTFRALEAVRTRSRQLSEVEEGYWNELKQWRQVKKQDGASAPHEALRQNVNEVIDLKRLRKDADKDTSG